MMIIFHTPPPFYLCTPPAAPFECITMPGPIQSCSVLSQVSAVVFTTLCLCVAPHVHIFVFGLSETFSFMLTGEDGSRRFGYCRRLLVSRCSSPCSHPAEPLFVVTDAFIWTLGVVSCGAADVTVCFVRKGKKSLRIIMSKIKHEKLNRVWNAWKNKCGQRLSHLLLQQLSSMCVCPVNTLNSVSRATNTQTTQVRFQWLQNTVIE